MREPRDIKPNDTCTRCGLRKVTLELQERGVILRLCDDCYWGKGTEPQNGGLDNPSAA
ncbi:MAG TPA: hypothetical protein VFU46_13975 [Gemmatimonadales bacterium]|nr:hypothetical protein [Gemmatimonadales bacterium]